MRKRRKHWNRIALLLVGVLLTGAVESAAGPLTVYATSATQDKINKAEEEKDKLEGNLDAANENIDKLEGEQNDLQKRLSRLNSDLLNVVANINSLEAQIYDKEREIVETQTALDGARATENWQYDSMLVQMRCMYERQETNPIIMLLSAGSFSELLNLAYYIERVMAYDQRQMEAFVATREMIEEQEAKLQTEKAELEALQALAEAEKDKVNGLIADAQASMAKYEDLIEEAEQKAKEYEAAIKAKEETLEALKKKLAEEKALAAAAANAAWRDISEVSFSEGDLYLLANLIYCEAGGEPYEGQLAVGAVVMNRVLSSKFPDSIIGVIYQNKQFSPVASGRLDLALATNKATESCYKAAEEAMSGKTNVGTCLFFRTPIPGLTGTQIGGHIFY